MKLYLVTVLGALSLSACASAHADPVRHAHNVSSGKWVLNPAKCPDLVEDWRDRRESRRDERIDRSRRGVVEDWIDRKESRRDEAVTRCPAHAWEWRGNRYHPGVHAVRPANTFVYYHPTKRVYYRRNGTARIVLRF